MEGAKARAERERLERIERELVEAAERAKALAEENLKRVIHLTQTGETLKKYDQVLMDFAGEKQSLREWNVFLECRQVPEINSLSQINTFIAGWIQDIQMDARLETVFKLSPNILQLIKEITEFLEVPPDNFSTQVLRSMGMIYHDCRRKQQEFIDQGTYNLMIDLRKLYDPELGVFESTLKTDQIVHSLWGNLYSCPEHRGHYYEELNFRFRIPDSLVMTRGIYRLLKTEYDYLSDTSNSFFQPGIHTFLHERAEGDDEVLVETPREIGEQQQQPLESEPGFGEELSGKEELVSKTKEDWGLVTSQVEVDGKKTIVVVRKPSFGKNGSESETTGKVLLKTDEMEGGMGDGTDFVVTETLASGSSCVTGDERVEKSEMVHDASYSQAEVGGETNEDIPSKEEKEMKPEDQETHTNTKDPEQPHEPPQPQSEEGKERQEGEETKGQEEKTKDERVESSKKGKKGKGKPSGKEDRPKTEAELAKERERKEKAQFLPLQVHPNELNLRNYVIQAGVFNFKLLEIPSQPKPKEEGGNWTLHLIEGERRLREIAFVADYIPPAVTDLHEVKKTPEEMEKEAKRQEEELQKLVQVEIKVPKICLWSEPPTPVRWEPELKIWSTDGFYDIRFNEDSLQMAFRTTKFGIVGLAHNRWANLPYQSWELRPGGTNKTTLSLMAAMAVVEFHIENDMICVSSLQNVSNSDVIEAAIVGKYMKHRQLIKALRYHGLDVFPELDSYAYVDGILLKHIAAEDHLYQCMAIGASAYNFHWSRWNMLAGREKMVYQLRERHGTATPGNYQMVLNTPRGASLINCTEVSPNYSEEPLENYEYRADLLQLINSISTPCAQDKIDLASGHFVETTRLLLTSIRPLTFS